ncbi:MAG TPA: hypothetical protein VF669_12845 [Tepidisphaeraceae bacterium]|jgi:hypothetical protein
MRVSLIHPAVLLLILPVVTRAENFDAQVQKASEQIMGVLEESEKEMTAGHFQQANQKLLDAFPEKTRTPAQSFILGNLVFEMDRSLSYRLHQAAALREKENAKVAWEWGLEQHRAGEYAGAVAAYDVVSRARPDFAVPYALKADCLLRLNQVNEAVAVWKKSEQARSGSIEEMESMICAVHREPAPYRRREELLARVMEKQDVDAAQDLICLDCTFPRDWWNIGPYIKFLKHDAAAIEGALKLPADDLRMRSMRCAVECALADRGKAKSVRAVLKRHRLLLDDEQTVPSHGGLLSTILTLAMDADVVDEKVLRGPLATKLDAAARSSKIPELWNFAAYAVPREADALLKHERTAWDATGNGRFAAMFLMIKSRGELAENDPDLQAALKQFPESGGVQRVAYEVAKKHGHVTRELLANAARAEFTHFSSFVAPATVVNRPRSDYLRQYFAELAKMPQEAEATTKPQ